MSGDIILFLTYYTLYYSNKSKDLDLGFCRASLNNIPPPIQHFFSNVYLFCLHKDLNDASKLQPIGIPTAIRRIIARQVAQTFKSKFAEYFMLPLFALYYYHHSTLTIITFTTIITTTTTITFCHRLLVFGLSLPPSTSPP